MKDIFLPFSTSFALKEIGFDLPCLKYQWTDRDYSQFMANSNSPSALHTQGFWQQSDLIYTISIPSFDQVFDWFREEHNIDAWAQPTMEWRSNSKCYLPDESYCYYIFQDGSLVAQGFDLIDFAKAQLDCVQRVIEHIKNKVEHERQKL